MCQYCMSHLVSQDDSELVNIRHSVQHPSEHEHFSILREGKYQISFTGMKKNRQ